MDMMKGNGAMLGAGFFLLLLILFPLGLKYVFSFHKKIIPVLLSLERVTA